MMLTTLVHSALLLLGGCNVAQAITLDINSDESIKSVAGQLAYDMMTEYKGNLSGGTPGLLPGPPPNPTVLDGGYFWWESGAMFGSLLDYWYYTGDTSYNDVIFQALLFQTGADNNYLPQNQSMGMGNDDQGFWGMTAMTAAEFNFQDPPPNEPQWLALAQAVFNTQAPRIDHTTCGGGLRWQAYSYLNGYDYKNSISNGCFFNIGARLAQYTKNETYAKYAEEIYDWMIAVEFIDAKYNIYDGASDLQNCTKINPVQYSYNAGIFLLGAATMYNYTGGSEKWRNATDGLLTNIISVFFPDGIAYEVACEKQLTCTVDMYAQKAFLTRWMAATTKVAPWTYEPIMAVLRTSAAAAALQCCGGPTGRKCGLSWSKKGDWDGTHGVGQQMAAMEVIQSLLIKQARETVTNSTGGTSKGDPNAGSISVNYPDPTAPTTGDKAGAGVLTAVFIVGFVGMCGFMSF